MTARSAIRRKPAAPADAAEQKLRQGYARQQAGDIAGAAAIYLDVLGQKPKDVRAMTLLATVRCGEGARDEARRLFEAALKIDASQPAPRQQLAIMALQDQDPSRALALIRPFTKAFHKDAKGWSIRGRAAALTNAWEEAVSSFRQAETTGDSRAAAHLGKALAAKGDFAAAIEAYRRHLQRAPDDAAVHAALGAALDKSGSVDEAVASYRRAVEINPANWEAHAALGVALNGKGAFDAAADAYGLALVHAPKKADLWNNNGNSRLSQGRLRSALAAYREALTVDPVNLSARRNLCMATAYDDAATSEDLAAVCRAAVADLTVAPRPAFRSDAGEILRVGFVSADFRHHSVSAFVEPLFANAAAHGIEVFAYSLTQRPDRMTKRLRELAAHWRDARPWSTEAAHQRIQADRLDILIDLAGQTSEARFDIFAARPAPVQASWLGWPATTGLAAIDFKISDALLTPPKTAEKMVEAPLNLSSPALCFQAPDDAPPIAPAPMLTLGAPTFGSFNRIFKASPTTLRLWAAAMAAVPDARLLLKNSAFGCPAATARFQSRLEAAGISLDRVSLKPALPTRAAHLAVYGEVDLALDSAPYNGVTTTCEALWMGVPTVSLAGDQALSRYGLSVMTHAGLGDYVARNEDEFAEIARRLVADPAALSARRLAMRETMQASALMNGDAFAAGFADGCRDMIARVRDLVLISQ